MTIVIVRPDKCAEASAVQALNTDLPRALRSLCATHGSGLIYISTDYGAIRLGRLF